MPVVERAHQPRRWRGFRATGQEFAKLVDEIARVVGDETREAVETEIEITEFERPFDGSAEFLENVDEREWTGLDEISARFASGPTDEQLKVALGISTEAGARLTLSGRNRRSRNAVEPDIVAAIEKRISDTPSIARANGMYVGPWYALAAVFLIGCTAVAFADVGSTSLAPLLWLLGAGVSGVTGIFFGFAQSESIRKALAPGEFLTDDGRSAWDRWRERWTKRAKLAGRAFSSSRPSAPSWRSR